MMYIDHISHNIGYSNTSMYYNINILILIDIDIYKNYISLKEFEKTIKKLKGI